MRFKVAIRQSVDPSHLYDGCVVKDMSQTSTPASKYNDGNPEARTTQLQSAKVEEGRIAELAKSRFEQLPSEIQGKLNSAPQ
jgi:hypothetical protein